MFNEIDDNILQVLEEYRPLIQKIAKSAYHSSPTIDYTDLCQVGELATINAVRCYDPTRGSQFSSYVSRAIRISIYNEAARFLGVFTVDHRVTELAAKVMRLTERGKTDVEIVEYLNKKIKSRNFDLDHVRDLRLAYSRRQTYIISDDICESNSDDTTSSVEEILSSVIVDEVDEIVLRQKLLGNKTSEQTAELAGVSVRVVTRLEGQLRERIESAIKKAVYEDNV